MRAHDVAACCSTETTGMAGAVLAEIAAALSRLVATGEETSIDLRGLPMTDADRSQLETMLGRGEVSATLTVAGRSEIHETGYNGVWWVIHHGSDERVSSEEIVVGRIPAILPAHPDDIAAADARLRAALINGVESDNSSSADIRSFEEATHAG